MKIKINHQLLLAICAVVLAVLCVLSIINP